MDETFEALVIAAYGRHLLIRDGAGREHKARAFGRGLAIVCGDRVLCHADPRHAEVHVREMLPRGSALYRSNARGLSEPVVANLTQLLVVLAPLPVPDLFVVDRYLAAATSGAIPATLLVNKRELGVSAALQLELEAYRAAGYAHVECSSRSGEGIEALLQLCAGRTATLVGQSGVGKSSLVQSLVPFAQVPVGDLVREEEGRHTTTAARLFDLPHGGHLIDSPGVRDFAPAIERLDAADLGFVEVARLAPGCRFQDCRHMREPACAVQAAAESGALHARRYESYRRLRRLHEDLTQTRGPGRGPGGRSVR
jgi:ribosome biogenesis GTPase